MRSNHILYWSTIFSCNNSIKAVLTIALTIILLQATAGCNPIKRFSFSTISPTASHTILPSITPTAFPTITPKATAITQWYIELIYLGDRSKMDIDLDTMETEKIVQSDSDFQFSVYGGSRLDYLLVPINGARMKSMGAGNIDLATCKKELNSLTENEIDIPADKMDEFIVGQICIISNEGRMFLIKIEDYGCCYYDGYFLHLFIKTDN